jgi:xanthine dehydrogenase accessory factor
VSTPSYPVLAELIRANRPVGLVTVVDGVGVGAKVLVQPDRPAIGSLGDPELDRVVGRDALGELDTGRSGMRYYGPQGQAGEEAVAVFIESFAPPPRLLIFGAVDVAAALGRQGKLLGFHVTVCDAREVFATRERFPMADEVVVDWPHRLLQRVGQQLGPTDAVCVLTHDVKFDVPALLAALDTDVGYIGAMGSRRTHADRVARLRDEGAAGADLARIMAPIGLDLGGRTPEETAVSIAAEIIAGRTGRRVPSLRDGDGPIHGAGSRPDPGSDPSGV